MGHLCNSKSRNTRFDELQSLTRLRKACKGQVVILLLRRAQSGANWWLSPGYWTPMYSCKHSNVFWWQDLNTYMYIFAIDLTLIILNLSLLVWIKAEYADMECLLKSSYFAVFAGCLPGSRLKISIFCQKPS